jgi:hypothetical protein
LEIITIAFISLWYYNGKNDIIAESLYGYGGTGMWGESDIYQ